MHILVTGAGGMIGRKFVAALARGEGPARIDRLTLTDIVAPTAPEGIGCPVECIGADFTGEGVAERLVAGKPDLIVHLAAVVSGEAEADFDKGYRVNLDGTRGLLEAIRLTPDRGDWKPRFLFTSSVATFGGPYPASIPDDFINSPQNSYGVQKVIGEMLLSDYTRRGFIDGIGLRLPTICIRPGAPNKAASGFFSGILREPLQGREAVLPVDESIRHWFSSPRAAVGYLLRAAVMESTPIGDRRTLNLPGLSATIGDEIEALRRAAGDAAVKLIRREPDPAIRAIVSSWPERFDATRARALGFVAEQSFDEIIRVFIEDELGG
ncbi:MAG: SDR family oxidoreductase [Rhodospirillales bacterium]